MASSIHSLYLNLPRSLQNAAITAYGMKEHFIRYGQSLPQPFDSLSRHGDLSPGELGALRDARLKMLVCHAAQYVPYYQRLFRKRGIDPAQVTTENLGSLIPVLEKSDVIADPSSFISSRLPAGFIRLFTSGTSGSPMPIVCTREARAVNYAFFQNMLERHGCSIRDRSATFAGRILFSRRESEVLWRKDYFGKTLLMSSYHLTNETIPGYIAALEAWNPTYIDSYPSAIGQVARYICEHRLKPKLKTRLVITSSETLSDLQRDQIETAFHCRVLDHYGCTEMAVSAYTRPDGRYFIEPLYSIVEFDRVPLLNTASLICTGLLNIAMPLLRYRIGDAVSDPQSNADQPFFNQTFERIVGREDDLVVTPDGRMIGRLDPAFKGLDGIKQSQIIQTDIASLEVLVVATEGADRQAISDVLTDNLLSRTSREMSVAIRFVDSIPLSASGKFKAVVSRLRRSA